MNTRQKRNFLLQYQNCTARLEALLLEREKWFAIGTKVNSVSDGMPHASSDESKVERSAVAIAEITHEIDTEISVIQHKRQVIRDVISGVEKEKLRTVLEMHFISGMTYAEIADKYGDTERNIYEVSRKAIEGLKI
jgi:DNA-directed RNA polymerase specialized sigma subunit